MKIKIEPQQLKKIKSLPTFEAKCEYWKETFACSYFQAFTISKDEDFRLIDEADNGEESQILFRYEFERVIELEPKVLMTSTRKEMFADLDRTKTFELLKKQFIEELKRLPHSWRKFGQYGFVSNNGLNELDDIIRAFRDCHDFKFIEPTILKNDIQSFIKGYKIKELLEDIKAYSKSEILEQTKALTEEGPTRKPTIDPNSNEGKRHAPSLTRTELAMLGFALREHLIIAGVNNLTSRNLTYGLHELTGYSQKQFKKDLESKKSIKDFQNSKVEDLEFIGKLKQFIHDLEKEITGK